MRRRLGLAECHHCFPTCCTCIPLHVACRRGLITPGEHMLVVHRGGNNRGMLGPWGLHAAPWDEGICSKTAAPARCQLHATPVEGRQRLPAATAQSESFEPGIGREQGLQAAAAQLLRLHMGTALFCREQGPFTPPAQSLRQRRGQAGQGWAGTQSAAAGRGRGPGGSVWRGHARTLHGGAGWWRRPESPMPAEQTETAPATSWPAEPGWPADLHILFANVGGGSWLPL